MKKQSNPQNRKHRIGAGLLPLLALVLLVGASPLNVSAADAPVTPQANTILPLDSANQIANQLTALGFTATASGSIVSVTGSVAAASGISLNPDPGVTVQWNAQFYGSLTSYLITLSGDNTTGFIVGNPGTLTNAGSGGAIRISGSTAVTVDGGGIVTSDKSGNGILISGAAAVTVNNGGVVQSLNNNANAAIQVDNNVVGASITVNGGSVISDSTGYAINDGAGTGVQNNNTVITINDGLVSAGNACAIHSTGSGSTVTITGGGVTSAAGSNSNPTVYMNCGATNAGGGGNITISGGTVENTATGNTSYAIQTTGSVTVSGGAVTTVNGRAINLVGVQSQAVVSGGAVLATGSGVAISTATTVGVDVSGTAVLVSGGTVSSTTGNAINVTGANSTVTITGGAVSATAGNAVNVASSASNAAVTVNGGAVSSVAGTAIYVTGTTSAAGMNATVTINGNTAPSTVSSQTGRAIYTGSTSANAVSIEDGTNGTQVYSMNTGNAIAAANGTVNVNGGFVFAYGAYYTSVISAKTLNISATTGIICAWDSAGAGSIYAPGPFPASNRDLNAYPRNTAVYWFNRSGVSGIGYGYGGTHGFFPLAQVAVGLDYGLIFNTLDGKMYQNASGSGIPSADVLSGDSADSSNTPFTIGQGVNWDSQNLNILILNNFSWTTGASVALTIYGGDATINLTSGTVNSFSSAEATTSTGIQSADSITVTGGGALNASGGTAANGSYGINSPSLVYTGGTVTARGDTAAIIDAVDTSGVSAYTYWTNTANADPGGAGTTFGTSPAYGAPYVYSAADQFVKLSPAAFAAVDDVTVSGQMNIPLAPQTATVHLYGVTLTGPLTNEPADDWFPGLPAGVTVTASGSGNTVTFTFSGTPLNGSQSRFNITLPGNILDSGSPLTVLYNANAGYEIAALYDLIVVAGPGGAVASPPPANTLSGRYLFGTTIFLRADPDPGYRFVGWTRMDIEPFGSQTTFASSAPSVRLSMPGNQMIMTANFIQESVLTVVHGGGGGTYDKGTTTPISADTPPAGKVFDHWKITSGSATITNANSSSTTIVLNGGTVTVEALYKDIPVVPPTPPAPSAAAGQAPQTGDDGNPAGWWIALLVSALGALIVWKLWLRMDPRKKRNRDETDG
ncbi:MAG: hypothetical protein FWF33_02325 [Clostridiales bacterium]|nr:hypothetical protein [Clostridiales bacterium]